MCISLDGAPLLKLCLVLVPFAAGQQHSLTSVCKTVLMTGLMKQRLQKAWGQQSATKCGSAVIVWPAGNLQVHCQGCELQEHCNEQVLCAQHDWSGRLCTVVSIYLCIR